MDTSDIQIPMTSIRYDQCIYSLDTHRLKAGLDSLGTLYPEFTNVYIKNLSGFGGGSEENMLESLRHFLTYKDYTGLYDTVQKHFPNTKELDKQLETLFKNIKFYYPKEQLGTVYYFITGLNFWSAVTVDTALGIGLDMYLGENYPFYQAVQIPSYDLINRDPTRISIQAAKAIFEGKFTNDYNGQNLLEMMIYKGKQLYFTEQVCREANDASIIGYTPEKEKWCRENTAMIYHYMAQKKFLYSTSWQDIMPLVNDGPTTAGMPTESPGNIGSWLGWQIVRKYMDEHPSVSLPALLELKIPAQQFLRESKFKP